MARTPTSTTLLAATAVWCLVILAAPVGSLATVYEFFSVICHQDPARSWYLRGQPLPVCIRCASIYFGFLASLLIRLPPNVGRLRWSIAVMLAEFVFARLVLDSAGLRSLSGIALGAAAAPFVKQGIEEMWGMRA